MNENDLKQFETLNDEKQLSVKQAWIFGSIFILAGLAIILLGFGVIHADPKSFHAPHWIIVCAGLMFTLGGISVINGYAFTKPNIIISDILGMSIVGLMTIVSGWTAFGPGERHFTTTSTFYNGPSSESSGRIVFGIGFILLLIFFIYRSISIIKKNFK